MMSIGIHPVQSTLPFPDKLLDTAVQFRQVPLDSTLYCQQNLVNSCKLTLAIDDISMEMILAWASAHVTRPMDTMADISYMRGSSVSKNLLMTSVLHLSSWVGEQYSPVAQTCVRTMLYNNTALQDCFLQLVRFATSWNGKCIWKVDFPSYKALTYSSI